MKADVFPSEIFAILRRPDRSGRPKYQRLSETFIEAIKQGHWRPGDRLPAEQELTELTPYSLGTIQRAIRNLADQGLVVRQHGLGNFVAEPSRQMEDPWHCRFLAHDGTLLPIFTKAVERVAVRGPGPWTEHFGQNADVMRLDRIISVNDEFRIYSRFYADRQLLKRLWNIPLNRLHGANFKHVIAEECRLPITDITHLVRVTRFDPETCERILVGPKTTGLFMQAIARAGTDVCVYYQEFSIPPNERALKFPEHTLNGS